MSLAVYGKVGRIASHAAKLNMAKQACQPKCFCTGTRSNWPRMEPKPATPSHIPEIVAMAFKRSVLRTSLPMSHSIIPITIVAPLSKVEKVVNKIVNRTGC